MDRKRLAIILIVAAAAVLTISIIVFVGTEDTYQKVDYTAKTAIVDSFKTIEDANVFEKAKINPFEER
ncbi:MAG TPA: hypothetical protein VFF28_04130 [Candidatus Nanoarchaeia archaeon]|nr:hypothetical protein [Candidatus Nanoarchaeia archaeon]